MLCVGNKDDKVKFYMIMKGLKLDGITKDKTKASSLPEEKWVKILATEEITWLPFVFELAAE